MSEAVCPRAGDPAPSEIARAIRPGCRRARGQRSWLRDVLEAIAGANWRRDRRENWEAIARVLAHAADWRTLCTRPGWDRVGQLAGRVDADGERKPLSRATVARCIAWLRDNGYLGVVESGSTPAIRTGVLYGLSGSGEGNLAAVYVLTTAGRHSGRRLIRKAPDRGTNLNETPSQTHSLGSTPHTRARAHTSRAGQWRACDRPESRTERQAAAEVIRQRSLILRRLSTAHVAHIAAPYFAAGWTVGDVLHAVDYRPGGAQWRLDADVRHPAAWMRYRLNAWHGADGEPGQSATQRRLAAAAANSAAAARAEISHSSVSAAAVMARRSIGQRPRPAPASTAPRRPAPSPTSAAALAAALVDVHDVVERERITADWLARRAELSGCPRTGQLDNP